MELISTFRQVVGALPYNSIQTVVRKRGFFDYLLSQIRLSATAQNDKKCSHCEE